MKTVVITGAGGGLGTLATQILLENDSKVSLMLLDNSTERLEILRQKVESKYKERITFLNGDVTNYAQIKTALANTKSVDALINAAGVLSPVNLFSQTDMDEWQQNILVNLIGTANMCHILLDRLKKSSRGKIINFAGGGAAYARTHHSAYASGKAAVVRFTETLALENPELDINSIAPGAHNTNIWKSETYDKPPQKWADPKRFQSFILFLCTSASDGITGKFLHIYDDWDARDYRTLHSDMYTMRRIDEIQLKKLDSNQTTVNKTNK